MPNRRTALIVRVGGRRSCFGRFSWRKYETGISRMTNRRTAARGSQLDYRTIWLVCVGQFWEGTWFESKSGHPPSWLRMFMTLLSTSRQVVFWYLYWSTEASFQILSYSPFHPLIPYRLKYLYRLKIQIPRTAGVLFELTGFRSSALELLILCRSTFRECGGLKTQGTNRPVTPLCIWEERRCTGV